MAVSILTGPVRGADFSQWAETTLTSFARVGVRTVFTTVGDSRPCSTRSSPNCGRELSSRAPYKSSRSIQPNGEQSARGIARTAGSTGVPRTAVLSPAAVLANVGGLIGRTHIDPARDAGLSWLPLYTTSD